MQPVLTSLTRGSIRKTIRALAEVSEYQDQWLLGVADVMEQECRLIEQLEELTDTSPDFISFFNIDKIVTKLEKNAPLLIKLFTLLCIRPLKDCQNRILMCMSVILQARKFNINAFQTLISIVAYENGLQNDGFRFLHSFGVVLCAESIRKRMKAEKEKLTPKTKTNKKTKVFVFLFYFSFFLYSGSSSKSRASAWPHRGCSLDPFQESVSLSIEFG